MPPSTSLAEPEDAPLRTADDRRQLQGDADVVDPTGAERPGVHAEVLDFPGVITWGHDLEEARRLLAGALVDMAETHWLAGEPLPSPDLGRTDPAADLEEPIHLLLTATSRVSTVSVESAREAA